MNEASDMKHTNIVMILDEIRCFSMLMIVSEENN